MEHPTKRIPVGKIDWIEEAYAHIVNCETASENAIASALLAIAVELRRLNDARDAELERDALLRRSEG